MESNTWNKQYLCYLGYPVMPTRGELVKLYKKEVWGVTHNSCLSTCQPACLSAYLSACLSICLFVCLTCFGIDGEEVLRVASSDAVTKASGRGAGVWVLSLNTYDGNILGRVLHDDWVVDRVRGQRGVVIDILYLKVESMHMSLR